MTMRSATVMAMAAGSMLLAGACSDDPQGEAPDAGHFDGGNARPDSGVAPTGVISNLPGVSWEAAPGSQPGLVLLSSNFVQENIGSMVFWDWYAEIENRGATTLCFAQITVDLDDASGTLLAQPHSYADAQPYKVASSTLSDACIPPGGRAAIWDIANPSTEVPVAQIRRGVYTFQATTGDNAVPHPAAPTVVSANVVDKYGDGNYWVLQGALLGGQGTIRNIGMDVYAKGANGLLVDRLSDTNLGTLAPGQQWSYETTSFKGEKFVSFMQFVSFIEGAALIADSNPHVIAKHADQARRAALQADRNARRASR